MSVEINQAIAVLKQGGVIAYPTESVYGLGCDPLQSMAVQKILDLKHRSWEKGLILIGSSFEQFADFVEEIDPKQQAMVFASWPGPVTWLFPAKATVPPWITGQHQTVAIRVTNHPIARALCEGFGGPIVSTSANRESELPARDLVTLNNIFPEGIDIIVPGSLGGRNKPSEIRDVATLKIVREG